MKNERATFCIITIRRSKQYTPAIQRGEWYVHFSYEGTGLTVSHQSGISVRKHLTPVQAAYLLRQLQTVPPCPVSNEEFIEQKSNDKFSPELKAWMSQVLVIIRSDWSIKVVSREDA